MFDKSDPIFLDTLSIEEEFGFEDIHLHGSPSSVQVIRNGKRVNLGVNDFIEDINSKGYNGVLYVGSEFRDTGKWRVFDKGVEVND